MYYAEHHAGQWNDADCEANMGYICMTYKSKTFNANWIIIVWFLKEKCKQGYNEVWSLKQIVMI